MSPFVNQYQVKSAQRFGFNGHSATAFISIRLAATAFGNGNESPNFFIKSLLRNQGDSQIQRGGDAFYGFECHAGFTLIPESRQIAATNSGFGFKISKGKLLAFLFVQQCFQHSSGSGNRFAFFGQDFASKFAIGFHRFRVRFFFDRFTNSLLLRCRRCSATNRWFFCHNTCPLLQSTWNAVTG